MKNLSYEDLGKSLEMQSRTYQTEQQNIEMRIKQNIPKEKHHENGRIKPITTYSDEQPIVYYVPAREKRKWSIRKFIRNLFKRKPKRIKDKRYKKAEKRTNTKIENVFPTQYSTIISYAWQLKADQEKYKKLKEDYLNIMKIGDAYKIAITKQEIGQLKSDIILGTDYLKNRMKEIKRSNLSSEDKVSILKEIYKITGIKLEPAHMKQTTEKQKDTPSTVEELKEIEKKVTNSKHLSQQKQILEQIRKEIIELTQDQPKQDKVYKL